MSNTAYRYEEELKHILQEYVKKKYGEELGYNEINFESRDIKGGGHQWIVTPIINIHEGITLGLEKQLLMIKDFLKRPLIMFVLAF